MGRPINMHGVKVGLLVAQIPVARRDGNIVWLCECECGRKALRTTAHLRQALRLGRECCCARCHEELANGYFEWRRQQRRAFMVGKLREQWALYGTLWSYLDEQRLGEAVLDDLEREFGPVIEDEAKMLRDISNTPSWQDQMGDPKPHVLVPTHEDTDQFATERREAVERMERWLTHQRRVDEQEEDLARSRVQDALKW